MILQMMAGFVDERLHVHNSCTYDVGEWNVGLQAAVGHRENREPPVDERYIPANVPLKIDGMYLYLVSVGWFTLLWFWPISQTRHRIDL